MENIDVSKVKIVTNILSFENSKLNISIQNVGKSPLPGYFYSFNIGIDNNKINDMHPKLNNLDNTNLYVISNDIKYLYNKGVGNFIASNLIKPDKIYYHSIDLSAFNIKLNNKTNIEGNNEYKFKEIRFSVYHWRIFLIFSLGYFGLQYIKPFDEVISNLYQNKLDFETITKLIVFIILVIGFNYTGVAQFKFAKTMKKVKPFLKYL